jgi:hypothetical protein
MSEEKKVTLFKTDLRSRYKDISVGTINYRLGVLHKDKKKQIETGIAVGKKQGIWIVQSTMCNLDKFFTKRSVKHPLQKKPIDIFKDGRHYIFSGGDETHRVSETELKEIYIEKILPHEDFSKIVQKRRKAFLYHYLKLNKAQ